MGTATNRHKATRRADRLYQLAMRWRLSSGGGLPSMVKGRPAAVHGVELSITWMWRWGSVELPELPHRATTSPVATRSPRRTVSDLCWRWAMATWCPSIWSGALAAGVLVAAA